MHKNALKVKNQIAWEDGFTFTYSDKEQNNNGLTDATLISPPNRIPTLLNTHGRQSGVMLVQDGDFTPKYLVYTRSVVFHSADKARG